MSALGQLLDCGPSPKGWSYYGPFSRCLKFGKLTHLGLDDETDPRTRGTLGHIGTGHLHMRFMRAQQGQDPNLYLPPEEAMAWWCEMNGKGAEHLDRMIETFRRYVARTPEPPGRRILAVEQEITGVLGLLRGQWGLWALQDARDVRNPRPSHVSGYPIEATLLNCPGHPEHNLPIYATRKLDLVFEDDVGRIYSVDMKFKSSDVNDSYAYFSAISGENALARILGRQLWPSLTGLVLWLIQTQPPWKIHRPVVPESPWRDREFPRDLHRLAYTIAQLERDEPNPDRWPMAQHTNVCHSRHEKGGCPAMLRCLNGPPGWSP